jgi:hypothetical protein
VLAESGEASSDYPCVLAESGEASGGAQSQGESGEAAWVSQARRPAAHSRAYLDLRDDGRSS